jgi:signal peptidase I
MSEPVFVPNIDEKSRQDPVLDAVLNMWTLAGEKHYIPITGRSMFPLIRNGDQVLVAHGCAGIRRGEVIVFRHDGKLIAHRVLRISKNEAGHAFLTKGDNVLQFDPPLRANEIVGRVLAIKRGEQQISLDTTIWRITGLFIAIGTLTWMRLYGWGRFFPKRLLGLHSSSLTTFFRRGVQFFLLLVRGAVFIVIRRWKS